MRIIYLHQYFNTPDMSGSTRSYELGRRLVAAGHVVDMVTSWRAPTERRGWFDTDVAGMRVHWLPVAYSNHMSFVQRVTAFVQFALSAARRAAQLEGDVVFASSTPLTIALPAVHAARRRRIPMVFEVRDLWPELPIAVGALRNPLLQWMARRLEKYAYVNAAQIVALSPGMAAGVADAGYPQSRITVVPNAADLELFARDCARGREFRARLGIGADQIVIGYAGTLGRINGVSYLVELAAALRDDARLVFLIVGDGQEREPITALARERGVLGRNLLMLDRVAKSEMPQVLWALDVATSLFLPIRAMESNSANKFFDALAAGCCVAINYGGWQAQILQGAEAGLYLSADPREAAAQVRSLADDPERLRARGRHARRLAEEQFSRDALAARLEQVLSHVHREESTRRGG
ncbi:MAG TPA: glycosyltransferase family 4 protein [Steroidobacteraceae bacterium]|jgi:glycosyltransferase involved in cell wall biosynthesis